MKHRQPIQFEPPPLDALFASMRRWLMHVLAWLAGARPQRAVRADLRRAAHRLRRTLCLAALARLSFTPRPHLRVFHHRVRRPTLRAGLRAYTRRALRGLLHGPLEARAACCDEILRDPEPFIAAIADDIARHVGRFATRELHPAPANTAAPALTAPRNVALADTS